MLANAPAVFVRVRRFNRSSIAFSFTHVEPIALSPQPASPEAGSVATGLVIVADQIATGDSAAGVFQIPATRALETGLDRDRRVTVELDGPFSIVVAPGVVPTGCGLEDVDRADLTLEPDPLAREGDLGIQVQRANSFHQRRDHTFPGSPGTVAPRAGSPWRPV